MGQGRSSLGALRLQWATSKALSNSTLRDQNKKRKYVTSSIQALRPYMQDARANLDGSSRSMSFFGVYDGHGGTNVTQYCKNQVRTVLLLDEGYPNVLGNALGRMFYRMDEKLKEHDEWRALANPPRFNLLSFLKPADWAQGILKFEGSTTSVALIRGYHIIAGIVSDSRGVLSTIPLGGYRVNGILPMSRVMGDFYFKLNKDFPPTGQMLTCDPDVRTNHAPRTPGMKIHATASRPSNGMLGARRLFSTKVQYVPLSEPSSENTVVVCLNDDLEDFRESYIGGLGKICEQCYKNGKRIDISKICDGHSEMFTTPLGGYFWLKLVFDQRHLLFPVIATNLYILGWKGGRGGTFVTKSNDDTDGYNLLEEAKVLSFSESYCDMVTDLAGVRIGPYAIRDAFDILYWFRGHGHQAARKALGIIVVNFCEAARLRQVSRSINASFSDLSVSVLGEENSERVHGYGSTCTSCMQDIDSCLMKQQPVTESSFEGLAEIRIFNRSGYEGGVFKYDEDPKTARAKYERSQRRSQEELIPTFDLDDWFSSEELRKRNDS